MEQTITKEEIEKLVNMKGEIRGIALRNDFDYILKKFGKEKIEEIEKKMEEFGYPIRYREIKALNFYPIGIDNLLLTCLEKFLGFKDKDFFEMGEFHTKSSLLTRLFMRYFGSIKGIVNGAAKMWRRYFSIGDIKVIEYNEKDKYAVLRLENFLNLPMQCHSLRGSFVGLLKIVTKGEVVCKETKCIHKGDKYHEFVLRWK